MGRFPTSTMVFSDDGESWSNEDILFVATAKKLQAQHEIEFWYVDTDCWSDGLVKACWRYCKNPCHRAWQQYQPGYHLTNEGQPFNMKSSWRSKPIHCISRVS